MSSKSKVKDQKMKEMRKGYYSKGERNGSKNVRKNLLAACAHSPSPHPRLLSPPLYPCWYLDSAKTAKARTGGLSVCSKQYIIRKHLHTAHTATAG